VDALRIPGAWTRKKDDILAVVREHAREKVVLFDEPFANSTPGPVAPPFGRQLAQLANDLLAVDGLKVVWSAADWPIPTERRSMRVGSNPEVVLDPSRWNGEGAAAEQLLRQPRGVLERFSPLELRLRVALVSQGVPPDEAVRLRPLDGTLDLLLRRLGERSRELGRVLGFLSVLRVPIPAADLDTFHADALSPDLRGLLERAILFGDPDGLRLHPVLVDYVRRKLSPDSLHDVHLVAASYHRMRFDRARAAVTIEPAVRHELEVLYHRSEAGDIALLDEHALWFSEQYVGLGRALSHAGRRHEAVRAYERAVEHDDANAYAHHYLAWNLDVDAVDPPRVEKHYLRATEIEPSHAWYQSRFIRFLVTRGRTRDAETAWDEALAAIQAVYGRGDGRIHEVLHAELARLLLHRGQLGFAHEVLDGLPTGQDEPAWLRAERRLLRALEEADEDRLVHPPQLPAELRDRPFLFDAAEVPAEAIWMPGRVASLSEQTCHLRVLRVAPTESRLAWLHLPVERVLACLDVSKSVPPAGTFVEIVEGVGGGLRIRRHNFDPFFDDALPNVFPRPDRYLRHRGAS
jgi:tetratricopeptide (TPR) repeat protein